MRVASRFRAVWVTVSCLQGIGRDFADDVSEISVLFDCHEIYGFASGVSKILPRFDGIGFVYKVGCVACSVWKARDCVAVVWHFWGAVFSSVGCVFFFPFFGAEEQVVVNDSHVVFLLRMGLSSRVVDLSS